MLKIKMVEGLKLIAKKPMIPAVITSGINTGNFDKTMIRTDLNNNNATSVSRMTSMVKLSYKFLSR